MVPAPLNRTVALQRAEGRGQRAEGREQRAEGREQRAEGRGQRPREPKEATFSGPQPLGVGAPVPIPGRREPPPGSSWALWPSLGQRPPVARMVT